MIFAVKFVGLLRRFKCENMWRLQQLFGHFEINSCFSSLCGYAGSSTKRRNCLDIQFVVIHLR